jgi:hypothetical protein
MSQEPPIRNRFQLRLQAISELASYLGHADGAMSRDPAEWYRSLIRALTELSEEAKQAEIELCARAVQEKALNVTEVAKAAKVSRNAVYARAELKVPDDAPQ